jgi:hypothetical protein
MSEPSLDGRQSISSDPSATSSHTLHSRYPATDNGNGEGSSGSTLRVESIGEQDFAQHAHRSSRSSGFLLDSSFPSRSTARQQKHTSAYPDDAKGKRGSRHSGHRDRDSRHSANGVASYSSPLSRQIGTGEREDYGEETIRIPKSRKSTHEGSHEGHDRYAERDDGPPRPTMDPNQIVNMALNLSESRRRNFSAGTLIAPQSSGPRRVTGGGLQSDGSFRDYGPGSSLRQYLNDQRRTSRTMSPFQGRTSPSGMRKNSASVPRIMSMSMQGPQGEPSEATLARRDKARTYIELRMEYLRLLKFLPPLKPDAMAPGNYIITANNVPGSPQAMLTRMPSYAGNKHELGRAYNPLQYIRNRRTRARERRKLDHDPEEFADDDEVREWVDRVERHAESPAYRQQDGVALPKIHEDHKRDNEPSKSTGSRMGWTFTSEELLADAHWLEMDDNKSVIEDRHGRKIFPPKEPPKQVYLDPRTSKEYPEKRRRSWVDGLPGLGGGSITGDDSDPTSERGRKRRLLPAFRSESPKKKHHWRNTIQRSGSYSESSDSDYEQQKRFRTTRKLIDVDSNTGPLGLHLRGIIEKEQREARTSSPDTPNKWSGNRPESRDHDPRSSVEVPRHIIESSQGGDTIKMPPKRMKKQLHVEAHRSSFDDLDSTAPNTPVRSRRPVPHFGTDLSPPPSRDGSVKKPKKSRLDIFRSDEGAKGHRSDPESAAINKKHNSRQASEESQTELGHAVSAPSAVKSLLTHRKNESVGSFNNPDKGSREHKEPPSAVTRFFKGVKNEGSKVGEFIFRRDRAAEGSDLETISDDSLTASDDEGVGKSDRKPDFDLVRSSTAGTDGSRTSKKAGRYHLDLPSFRSQNQNDPDKPYASDSHLNDPISRQARAQANERSSRLADLAPPRMDIRSRSASPSLSRGESPDAVRDRMNRILARPGGVGHGGLPMNPLAIPQHSGRQRSTSRPNLGRRHWSITDENGNILHRQTSANRVTPADIARVRALFLCSGVKAREIARRAQEIRAETPGFLRIAADAANVDLIPIPRKEEYVLAARILTRTLETTTQALHTSADQFRDHFVQELSSQITALKSHVDNALFPSVRSLSDSAVKITSDVSGSVPLAVKQIVDEIDTVIRARRRRMRWVRRVGWMLVEWALVGVMWVVWLVVVVLGMVRRVAGAGVRVVRWLLWV